MAPSSLVSWPSMPCRLLKSGTCMLVREGTSARGHVPLTATPDAMRCDAMRSYRGFQMQHSPKYLLREVNKAAAAFQPLTPHLECSAAKYPTVATGNWGCGAFGGDVQIKAVLQWLAASLHGRPLRYYPFGNARYDGTLPRQCWHCFPAACAPPPTARSRRPAHRVEGFADIVQEARAQRLTVGQLWGMVVDYGRTVLTSRRRGSGLGLFAFIAARCEDEVAGE